MFIKFKYNDEELIGKLHSIVEEGNKPFIYDLHDDEPLKTNVNKVIGTWGRYDEFKKLYNDKLDFQNLIAPIRLYWIAVHFLSWGVDEYYLIPENKIMKL